MAQLFGFQIQRATKEVEGGEKTFTTPTPDDGTVDVAGGGFLSSVLNKTDVNVQTLTLFVGIETSHCKLSVMLR